MTPTKEQLADPKWWNQNAPSDARYFWESIYNSEELAWSESIDPGGLWWDKDHLCHMGFQPSPWLLVAVRPTQPQWTGPEVGKECKFSTDDGGSWDICKPLYFGAHAVFLKSHKADKNGLKEYSVPLSNTKFRPIRTQAEIERDAVISEAYMVTGYMSSDGPMAPDAVEKAVNELYDAGMLRKPMTRDGAGDILHDMLLPLSKGSDNFENDCFDLVDFEKALDALGYKD